MEKQKPTKDELGNSKKVFDFSSPIWYNLYRKQKKGKIENWYETD